MAVNPVQTGLKAEINVTPLVDVVLVLLIIFMVITPMLTRGRDVQLPEASSADSEQPLRDAIVLTISAKQELWLESERVDRAKLLDTLKQRLTSRGPRGVLIKADASVSVRDLRPVLQTIKAADVSEIAFSVLTRSGGGR